MRSIVRCDPGEGVQVSLLSSLAEAAPHPNPLPAKAGRGRRGDLASSPHYSLLRHHGQALIPGADLVGGGREIQLSPAPVGAAACDQKAVLAGDDVALAQRRVALDLDRRETDLILAIAGAAADELVAIAERVRQVRIGLAVFGGRVVDAAAGEHLGFARRAEAVAAGRAARIVRSGDREITTVAGPHAKRLATASTVADASLAP